MTQKTYQQFTLLKFSFKRMQANKFLETLSFSNIYLALFFNHHQYYVLGLIRQLTVSNSKVHVVSSAAVCWDVTQCSPQRNVCSQLNHIPLPILANHSFGVIFKNQFAPNSPFETYRAQSESVIPSSETSQINMRISGQKIRRKIPKTLE